MWCRRHDVSHDIRVNHKNERYLPGFLISKSIAKNIEATSDLEKALKGADIIFEATPVKYLRSVFENIKTISPQASKAKWVILSKGIEQHSTNMLPTQILEDVFGSVDHAVVGGPNFAVEVISKLFTATMVASSNQLLAEEIANLLDNGKYLKAVVGYDTIGVQVCGAIKNVIAILLGIANGAGYKENAKAYLLTQGLQEISKITQFLGGNLETAYSIAGLGDLVLTSMSDKSKNFRVGILIGQGLSLEEVTQHFPVLPEGINTAKSLHEMGVHEHLTLPLCQATYNAIFHGKNIKDML